jgi:hypothetical protein
MDSLCESYRCMSSAWRCRIEDFISVPSAMCRLSMAYLPKPVRRESIDRPEPEELSGVGQWHKLLVEMVSIISTSGSRTWKKKTCQHCQDDCISGKHSSMLLSCAATRIPSGCRRIDARKLRLQTAEVGGSRSTEMRTAMQQKPGFAWM